MGRIAREDLQNVKPEAGSLSFGRAEVMRVLAVSVVLLFLIRQGLGQSPPTPTYSDESVCAPYAHVVIPATDSVIPPSLPAKCDSKVLYYGIGTKVDYAAARACAYRERSAGIDGGDPIHGEVVLSMIYANGFGVARNTPLAKHFACEIDGVNAEEALESVDQSADSKDFDICSAQDGAYWTGMCGQLDSEIESAGSDKGLLQITKSWNAQQKAALERLRKSAKAFLADQVYEVPDRPADMSRLASDAANYDEQQNAFIAKIKSLESGKLPPSTNAAELAKADHALNLAYAQAIKTLPAETEPDTGDILTKGLLRKTQREWIAYREAWVSFAAVRYPSISADSIRKWLTDERTKQLIAVSKD